MAWLDNFVEAWHLNESSAADAVGAYAGITLTQHNSVGASGGARSFASASTQYFDHADSAALSAADISLTLAIRVKLTTKSANMAFVGKCNDPSTDATIPYLLSYSSSLDRFRFTVGSGSASQAIAADNLGAVSTGVEYLLIAEHDATGNTVSIQVDNGTPNSASYSAGSFDDTGLFEVGALNNVGAPVIPHNGTLRELHFWKRVLTTQEKTDLYNGLVYPFPTSGMFFGM